MRVFVFWTKKSDIKTFRYLVVTNKPFDGVNEAKLLQWIINTQNRRVIELSNTFKLARINFVLTIIYIETEA